MAGMQEGGSILIRRSVPGSVFPNTERELVCPVLVDGSTELVQIEGALYGRSIELRGDVMVRGPVVARGDARLNPVAGRVFLGAGITINGTLNCLADLSNAAKTIQAGVHNAAVIIKGDVSVNQNVALKNTILFGSLRAVNCSIENSLVLGTTIVEESLKVAMSSIGGYAAREVTFAGNCVMLHALGESRTRPLFAPHEAPDGSITGCDVHYYPAMRGTSSLVHAPASGDDAEQRRYSRLFPETDWVQIRATANTALDEGTEGVVDKWVLSIGGRIGDISKISHAVNRLTQMLKCGFEYEHYHLGQRRRLLEMALTGLTEEERWILETVCQ